MPTSPSHAAPRAPARALPRTARRFGHLVGAGVNVVLLYLVNRSPGWDAVPFLTDETTQVLGIVNASIVVGLVAQLVYVVWDPDWLRALGDVVTTGVGLLALVRIWQVWPIDLPTDGRDALARAVVALGVVGSVIGVLAGVVRLVRALVSPRPTP